MSEKPLVVVGMSGGVDSSVSAYLLKEQGYRVVGLFMRNWDCDSAEEDYADVKRVCESLDIPYYSVNFEKEYMDNVFKIFLDGLKMGLTPNPDILCNREIKFGPFLDFAKKIGADYIATGHYARVKDGELYKGIDEDKDQSYFLCALTKEQLSKVLFPVGELKKTKVREIAKQLNLITATKKDSTGICFIGERKIREFLKDYLGNQPGDIVALDGTVVGQHVGLMYYTIGQRKGLGIGGIADKGDSRWYVVSKDLGNNILHVNNGEGQELFSKELTAMDFNWISPLSKSKVAAKTRYRQPDQSCSVSVDKKVVKVDFDEAQRAITPGQWVVLYDGDKCLGGGVICS